MIKVKTGVKPDYIIDSHAHLGYWPTLNQCKANLLESTKNNNIDFTLLSFDGSEFKENNSFLKPLTSLTAAKKVLSFINDNKEHFGLLIWIRPFFEKNAAEIELFIKKHIDIIYGLKVHPFLSRVRMTDERLCPYIEVAEKLNLPILVHTAKDKYSQLKYLIRVCKKYPKVKFIAAHCVLETDHNEIIAALLECKNLYCDTAWVDINFIKKLIDYKLTDKILFGTDNPIDGIRTLDEEIYQNYFNNSIRLTKSQINKIMYKNAIKLYDIKINN